MSNLYLELIREVITLNGYTYRVWEYQASLSQLTLRAYRPNEAGHNLHIIFQGVAYFQMPIYWEVGDFRLGPEAERQAVAKRIGLEDFDSEAFFKANTPNGVIYILGSVVDVLRDVEPLY